MALAAELYVNRRKIGVVVVTRVSNVDSVVLDDSDISDYSVYVRDREGITNTTVRHRYGDGALHLLHRALGETLEVRSGLRHQREEHAHG